MKTRILVCKFSNGEETRYLPQFKDNWYSLWYCELKGETDIFDLEDNLSKSTSEVNKDIAEFASLEDAKSYIDKRLKQHANIKVGKEMQTVVMYP